MKIKKVASFLLLLCLPAVSSQAYWVWSPEAGKFVNPEEGIQDTAEEQYEYAMKFFRDKDYDKAEEELKSLLKKYRGAKIAAEAQYRLGIIYEEKSDYLKAYETYKVVLESYPQSARAEEVIERQFKIGNLFLSGRKAKLMGLEIVPSLSKACEVFESIIKNAPFSAYGDQAQFRLGLSRKKQGQFDKAVEAFQAVIDNYPKSDLVSEARFQLAETAYLRSNYQGRDERALDSAGNYVDSFLARNPDSEAAEKASKLREEIDEKNAEKNYRIGLYYEKTKYLSSAIIYYRDVAKRYPSTRWGQKAQEKLQSLQEPVSFLKDQEQKVESEIQLLKSQIDALKDSKDSAERDALERKIERLKQRQKAVDSSKKESLKSREEDLKRREQELKLKIENLNTKKKLLETNKSEDLAKAIDRWQASLDDEKEALAVERRQLGDWKESMGFGHKDSMWDVLPFIGEEPSELDQVRRVDAKKLFKVSDEKKQLLESKELLYKQYQEVAAMMGDVEGSRIGMTSEAENFQGAVLMGGEDLQNRQKALEEKREEVRQLERELEEQSSLYKKRYGASALASFFRAPARLMSESTSAVGKSLDALNPFDRASESEVSSLDQLLEKQMHLKEKITVQRNLVDILTQAFDDDLAMQEQKRLLSTLEKETNSEQELRDLRKATKHVEKEIRTAYSEIGDRHEKIKSLTRELEQLLESPEANEGRAVQNTVTAPARFVAKGARDFLFGRQTREARLSNDAEKLPESNAASARAKEIKEEIELQGLLIEARNREIYQLKQELDILRTKASLSGGYQFRSAIVKVPYEFLEEALDSARSVVPRKERKDMLISRLDKETRDLEDAKQQLLSVESRIAEISGTQPQTPAEEAPAEEASEPLESDVSSVEASEMKRSIEEMSARLESAQQEYQSNRAALESEARALQNEAGQTKEDKDWSRKAKKLSGQEGKLREELEDLQKELSDLIRKEGKLEEEETGILENRINKIDQLIQRANSKASAQDLLNEKERLEERLTQIESRRSFLNRELERFQINQTKA